MVKPDGSERRLAMFKNGHLRLLMTLVGFQRIGVDDDPEASWVVPSPLFADQLKQSLDLIKKFEFSPPVFDDGQEAGDFIRRKSAAGANRKRAVFDDEDEGIDDDDEEEFLFPAGGPTAMKKSEALEVLKKNRRRRRKEGTEDAEDNGLTDEQLKARAEARRQRELEKNRKIKSDLYVHDSDEEENEERDRIFFEQEEKLRQRSNITIMKELLGVGKDKEAAPKANAKKRQSTALSDESDDDDIQLTSTRKRHSSAISVDSEDEAAPTSGRSSSVARDNVLAESDEEATDTPMSSPHDRSSHAKRRKVSSDDEAASPEPAAGEKNVTSSSVLLDDDEDEDDVPAARPVRQRVRAGFIVDSSDEE